MTLSVVAKFIFQPSAKTVHTNGEIYGQRLRLSTPIVNPWLAISLAPDTRTASNLEDATWNSYVTAFDFF